MKREYEDEDGGDTGMSSSTPSPDSLWPRYQRTKTKEEKQLQQLTRRKRDTEYQKKRRAEQKQAKQQLQEEAAAARSVCI